MDSRNSDYMNIGLWFDKLLLKKYYGLDQSIKEDKMTLEDWVKTNSLEILNKKWVQYTDISQAQFLNSTFNSFEIKTIYPGLVCGIGYEHEIGYINEFKPGFSFDYTTGLPYIPGSSIKGTLRSAFKIAGYMEEVIKSLESINLYKSQIDWKKLELAIFEGKEYATGEMKPSTKVDVFFDSFISLVEGNGSFLCDDYITSHRQEDGSYSPLKEPNPVRFIKVRPDVTFKFQFRLGNDVISDNIIITGEIKSEIFKMILLDLGIGAKTNVGYGQFIL